MIRAKSGLKSLALIALLVAPVTAADRRPEDLGVIPTPQAVEWSDDAAARRRTDENRDRQKSQ